MSSPSNTTTGRHWRTCIVRCCTSCWPSPRQTFLELWEQTITRRCGAYASKSSCTRIWHVTKVWSKISTFCIRYTQRRCGKQLRPSHLDIQFDKVLLDLAEGARACSMVQQILLKYFQRLSTKCWSWRRFCTRLTCQIQHAIGLLHRSGQRNALKSFFAQGDQERSRGIPVQFLNDRLKLNRPNSQIGFIEFMIAPFFAAQIWLWPNLFEYGTCLSVNIGMWQELWEEEVEPSEDELEKVTSRVDQVQEMLSCAAMRIAS
mmetsp:Transcript_70899/g.166373  ORF Transcript_70899/g.166373 Transcript_70899/m.166373 type:complete len:260 (-) Transcript_70899:199-978(-)